MEDCQEALTELDRLVEAEVPVRRRLLHRTDVHDRRRQRLRKRRRTAKYPIDPSLGTRTNCFTSNTKPPILPNMSESTDTAELGRRLLQKSRTAPLRSKMEGFAERHWETDRDLKELRRNGGKNLSEMVDEGREERV